MTLLVLWAALGAVHTAIVMARPQGVRATRAPGAGRAIGMTDAASGAAVTALAEAIERVPGDPARPVLVRFPAGADTLRMQYLRYQLNHVVYPRPVDVAAGAAPARLAPEAYAAVVVAPGADASELTPASLEHRGYRVYQTSQP